MMSSSSSSSSSFSSSVAVLVDKATSDLLIGPDWTMNMEICDSVNTNNWQAKDVVKAVKKRLLHKSSTVQLLTLTLLETMVKNCGDYVHFQIVERNLLHEMIKMVKKKADTRVRTRILVLLDSWQEAFGGSGGKYPQYFWAYEELRRSGIQFPKRSPDAVPIFTPPATHTPVRHAPPSSSNPPNSGSKRLDEAMASDAESLSYTSRKFLCNLSGLDAMGRVANLLTDMLRAVNPSDREAVKDEVIVDLADQCRSNQKRLIQMLTSTVDEELLARGLDLNDKLQSVLAEHEAKASGVLLPTNNQKSDNSTEPSDAGASSIQDANKESELVAPVPNAIVPVGSASSSQVDDVDDEDDDFSQLARRHSRHRDLLTASSENLLSSASAVNESLSGEPVSNHNNALVLADPLPPTGITKEQDMIDFLSLALTTTSVQSPAHESPVSPTKQVQSNDFQTYPEQAGYNNYVAPWALPQRQPQPQPHPQQFHHQDSFLQQNGVSLPTQNQPFQTSQSQIFQQQQGSPQQASLSHQPPVFYTQNVASQQTAFQQQPLSSSTSPQYPQYPTTYIPPPWAATPGYYSNQRPTFSSNTPQSYGASSYASTQSNRPLQYNIGSNMQNDSQMSTIPMTSAPAAVHKPFIPSYRLFEDLDVFKQIDGRVKDSSSSGSPRLGGHGQGMVGGNK